MNVNHGQRERGAFEYYQASKIEKDYNSKNADDKETRQTQNDLISVTTL